MEQYNEREIYDAIRPDIEAEMGRRLPDFDDLPPDERDSFVQMVRKRMSENASLTLDQSKRYRDIECSRCYQLLPKNLMTRHENTEVSGWTSGQKFYSSLSSSTGSDGRYIPNRIRASETEGYISGQKFYNKTEVWYCPECEAQFQSSDEKWKRVGEVSGRILLSTVKHLGNVVLRALFGAVSGR